MHLWQELSEQKGAHAEVGGLHGHLQSTKLRLENPVQTWEKGQRTLLQM